jgi:eukaryotic-like serine/threonine-protein kinase
MTNARIIDRIFSDALTVAADQRDELLNSRCGDDQELYAKVLALLQASDRPEGAIEDRFDAIRNRLWQSMLADDSDHEEDLTGSLIGPWSVGKRIARGGLATVYQAQRSDGTYHQRVALKVLRRGLDTDDLVTRFRAERQILSALKHPGIAGILDGGALNDGRPYLVLEFVDGLTITEYCTQNKLGIRARMRLMAEVSRAVHHAHQHLVVHRDIKPSNILVTKEGDVSLLDFGIAKLLDPMALPSVSPLTRTGVSMLTPAYASPEQYTGKPVTTASDIYQLGLVLYELLTGTNPFASGYDPKHGFSDLPAPSDHLAQKNQRRQVKGDLDAIVHKAAHTDPERRYASADELVADLERYLDGLPVRARPDTLGYRLSKLNERKPWLLPLIFIATIAIAGYVVTLSLYSERLAAEQRLAAETQAFLIDLFKSPDPFAPADADRGSDITVVEALDIGQSRVRTELAGQPELQASLLSTISDVYKSLDQSEKSIALREEALTLERDLYGNRSAKVVASLRSLGNLYSASGDVEKGTRLTDEQLAIAYQIFGDDDPELGLAEIASGSLASFRGNLDKSQQLLEQGIDRLRPAEDEYAREIINALVVLAEKDGQQSREQGIGVATEALAVATRVYGPDSLQVASARIRVASTLSIFGSYDDSERNFLTAIPVLEANLGENHSVTLSALNNLGYLYHRRGDEAQAEQIHRRLLERQIANNGRIHRSTADSYQNLAGAITRQGRYDESLPLHWQAHEIYKQVLNDDNYLIAFPLLSITYVELMRGNGELAEQSSREALTRFQATVAGTFLEGVALCLVGLSLEKQGRVDEGSAMVVDSHELLKLGSVPDPYPELCRLPVD